MHAHNPSLITGIDRVTREPYLYYNPSGTPTRNLEYEFGHAIREYIEQHVHILPVLGREKPQESFTVIVTP